MCLAIPMKVVKIDGDEGVVEALEIRRKVNFAFLKNVRVGEYILLHAGFAIAKVNAEEANKTIRLIREL